MNMDKFDEHGGAKALNSAIEKLGKHFLLSLRKMLDSAQVTLHSMDAYIGALQEDKAVLQRDKDRMDAENRALKSEVEKKEERLRKFSLVGDALGAKAEKSEAIQRFDTLVRNDFKEFCDHENALLNDIVAYQQFQHIIAEMRLLANCPALYSKTIGAIGGGFSSGKSAFVNSLIGKNAGVRMAEGIRPVTAIPSYVLHDTRANVRGVNEKGASFDIALEMYNQISPEFLDSFSFNLREIIPYIIVGAPMPEMLGHLCFIDTPGYNPAAGRAGNDLETAREYIKDARFLIWMVGLDSNGTIPQSDLDFLDQLEFGKTEARPLYIVASKAELKAADEIEEILDDFASCLDDADLRYAGISACSSRQRKVYATRGQGLFEFLWKNNAPRQHHGQLIDVLCGALRPYVEEIYRDDHQKSLDRKEVRTLLMEALKAGVTDVDNPENPLEEGLQALEKRAHVEDLKIRLERLRALCDKFIHCMDDFCTEIGMKKTDVSTRIEKLFDKPALEIPSEVIVDAAEKAGPKEKPATPEEVSSILNQVLSFSGTYKKYTVEEVGEKIREETLEEDLSTFFNQTPTIIYKISKVDVLSKSNQDPTYTLFIWIPFWEEVPSKSNQAPTSPHGEEEDYNVEEVPSKSNQAPTVVQQFLQYLLEEVPSKSN